MRKIGVAIIAIWLVLGGAYGIFLALTFIRFDTVLLILTLFASAGVLALGVGLWKLKNWARIALIVKGIASVVTGLAVAVLLPSLFFRSQHFSLREISLWSVPILIEVLTTVYLIRPAVAQTFRAGGTLDRNRQKLNE